jgi:hypothetical protein
LPREFFIEVVTPSKVIGCIELGQWCHDGAKFSRFGRGFASIGEACCFKASVGLISEAEFSVSSQALGPNEGSVSRGSRGLNRVEVLNDELPYNDS